MGGQSIGKHCLVRTIFLPALLLAGCGKKPETILQPGCLVPKPISFATHLEPALKQACYECHSSRDGRAPSAHLDLEAFAAEPEAHLVTWRRALQKITDGEMPPPGNSRPRIETCEKLVLAEWLDTQSARTCAPAAPALSRRLSNAEYDRSLWSLLGLDLKLSKGLPEDLPTLGFDSLASGLRMTPDHLSRYVTAAEAAATAVLEARPVSLSIATGNWDGSNPIDGFHWLNSVNDELAQTVTVTRKARYRIRIQAYGEQAGPETVRMGVLFGPAKMQSVEVPAVLAAPDVYEIETAQIPLGTYRLSVRFLNDFFEPTTPAPYDRNLRVGWAEIVEIPAAADEPLAKTQQLTHCQDAETPALCADRILTQFARSAYRRPLSPEEATALKKIGAVGLEEGFEESLTLGFQAILTSPTFLFKIEEESHSNEAEPLSGEELATRLSYFLWSAPPDEALLKTANQSRLQGLGNLLSETRRLLRDPKASALTDNFAEQWLELRELENHNVASSAFPELTSALRGSMVQETKLLFSFVLNAGLNVEKLLLADFSFLDRSLANFYGVSGVETDEFQLVRLAGTDRGGILTHASVLTSTSHPERTSPTLRGKWILNNLLCLPPPPPMPGIPVLPEKVPAGLTMRQLMELHASKPACASCHKQMDPLGFGLENFDAIGKFRNSEGATPVNASGVLPTGQTFRGAFELSQLVAHRPEYQRCLSRKLFTYALGRDLKPAEECVVAKAVSRLQEKNSFGTLIEEIVQSDLFRKKGGEDK